MAWRPSALPGGFVPLSYKVLRGQECYGHLVSKTVVIRYARVTVSRMTSRADCTQDDFLAGRYSVQHRHRDNASIDTILVSLGSSNQALSQDQRHHYFLASNTVRTIPQTKKADL